MKKHKQNTPYDFIGVDYVIEKQMITKINFSVIKIINSCEVLNLMDCRFLIYNSVSECF